MKIDQLLAERLNAIAKQIEKLVPIEALYMDLAGSKEGLHGVLYLKAEGKTSAEKNAKVYASAEWTALKSAIAAKGAEYNREKRWLEMLFKAYDAAHATFKIESSAIIRGVE